MENSEEKKLEMGNEVLNQNEENEKMMTVEEAIKEEDALAADGTNDEETTVDDEMADDSDEEDDEEENDSGFDWGMEDAAAAGILTLAGVGVAVAIKKAIDFFMDEDDAEKKEEKK